MVELLVAMGFFLTIAGAVFTMYNRQQAAYIAQQGQTGINIALRNAAAQMQIDLSNAGTAYFQSANIPAWPVGVTIVNNVVPAGQSCYNSTTSTYTAQCFDVLNVISGANPAQFPPINATDSTGGNGGGNCTITSNGVAYGQAASGLTLAQTAGNYARNDQLLFLTSNGKKMTSVVLTAAPTVAGSAVKFVFNSTNADGTNSLANDPLDITACDNQTCPTPNNFFNQFCGSDWIIKLAPITYQVNSSNSADPQLTRTTNGNTAVIMDQIIGFRIGATIWNNSTDTVSTQYNYSASTYSNANPGDQGWNFTLVRSLRISLIGRTTPNFNPAYAVRNIFDNGPYQVEGLSLVVNPRNMSMND